MRLICPNCDAQYEIDDHAVPAEGRDVQCSNCGHTWFQQHPSAITDDPDTTDTPPPTDTVEEAPAAPPAAQQETRDETDDRWDNRNRGDDGAPGPEPQPDTDKLAAAVSGAIPRRRDLNEDVAAILREEADREARARHAEAAALESQGDLGLDETPRRDQAGRQAGHFADPFGEDGAVAQTGRRRSVLPDIDQINTTLAPPKNIDADDDDPEDMTGANAEKRGFRRGFALTLVIGAILLAIYAFSPQIVERVPALAQPLSSYASAVDAGRVWLDETMTGLIATINANQ